MGAVGELGARRGRALAVLALLGWAGIAHAQCDPTTCTATDVHTTCLSNQHQCILIDPMSGLVECIPIQQSQPPLGTPCETDANDCTTDACGGTTGATTGDGVCHHTSVPDSTACGGGNGACQAGVCACNAGYKSCNGACIVASGCCVDDDCLGLARCLEGATCVDHVCMGTPKTCTPSGTCRVSTCDDGSGQCVETIASAGTACSLDECLPNAACDDHGGCVGDPAPDGTPCTGSCGSSVCEDGLCCAPEGGSIPTDLGTATSKPTGCSASPGLPTSAVGLLLLVIVAVSVRRRIVEG